MTKVIKLCTRNIVSRATDKYSIDFEDQGLFSGDINIYYHCDIPVAVYLTFDDGGDEEITIPVFTGQFLNQTYNVENLLRCTICAPDLEKFTIAVRIRTAGTRYRDHVSPIPKTAPVALNSNSLEHLVMKAVEARLSLLGPGYDPDYKEPQFDEDDVYDDEDDEFGPGYTYDPEVDREIDEAATRAVAARFKPDADGLRSTKNDNRKHRRPTSDRNNDPAERGTDDQSTVEIDLEDALKPSS